MRFLQSVVAPEDANGYILGQLVPVVEDNYEVDVELDLELLVEEGRARVNLGEEHIQGDLHVRNNVAVGHLDVLHFRSLNLSFKRLDSYQLNFYRLNMELGLLAQEEAIEGLVEVAID